LGASVQGPTDTDLLGGRDRLGQFTLLSQGYRLLQPGAVLNHLNFLAPVRN
jgi:hypothetical protein